LPAREKAEGRAPVCAAFVEGGLSPEWRIVAESARGLRQGKNATPRAPRRTAAAFSLRGAREPR
jgi:hypothetical protein